MQLRRWFEIELARIECARLVCDTLSCPRRGAALRIRCATPFRIVALHKDGRGYMKFGNSLELSYSTVARVIQWFLKTGFTLNRPRKGRSKTSSLCAVHQVQKLASKNRRMSAASIALEVAEVEGQLVSAQTILHTLQQVSLHGRRHRRKPLLKLAHKKACKQFAEDNLAKRMNYWNHVLLADES